MRFSKSWLSLFQITEPTVHTMENYPERKEARLKAGLPQVGRNYNIDR